MIVALLKFQYGLMDVGDFDGTDDNFDDDGDDDDLEAELLALTSDGGHKKPTAKSMYWHVPVLISHFS